MSQRPRIAGSSEASAHSQEYFFLIGDFDVGNYYNDQSTIQWNFENFILNWLKPFEVLSKSIQFSYSSILERFSVKYNLDD